MVSMVVELSAVSEGIDVVMSLIAATYTGITSISSKRKFVCRESIPLVFWRSNEAERVLGMA